jgi:hypothetical protein
MGTGEGKGWSRGKTAASDPRVARNVAAHRGMTYQRRTPEAEMKWIRPTITTLPIEWSSLMAYIVGLTATDGCLLSGRRAINFKSVDRELVETYRTVLGRTNKISVERTRARGFAYKVQFSDARLYRWFEGVGLMPRKSLRLGAIDVPDEFLAPLVRGLLDGDGNITDHVWKADTTRRSDYYYEWFRVRFASASRPHLDWLKTRLTDALQLRGWIWFDVTRGNGMGCLSYGKHDSMKLLAWLYADQNAPCLVRKRLIWESYARRHPLSLREPTSIYA